MYELLRLFTALSFLVYGTTCLTTAHMREEFERYGLPQFRILTGWLQLAGAVGLILGFWFPWLGDLAALGLALLMLLGVGVRVKIRDPFLQAIPALSYFGLSFYLFLGGIVGG